MGKPTVKISAYKPVASHQRLVGLMKGKATIPDDFGEWDEEEARFLQLKI